VPRIARVVRGISIRINRGFKVIRFIRVVNRGFFGSELFVTVCQPTVTELITLVANRDRTNHSSSQP
jgi:hypothetical protein